MLPDDWQPDKIGEVASLSKAKYDPKTASEDLICIELEHIAQESGSLIGSASAQTLSSIKTRFSKGDVLFGKLRPYLKKYAKPDFSGVCSTEIWVLRPRSAKITSDYLFQIVQSQTFLDAAKKSCGTKMPRAVWGVVADAEIVLPPLPEQKRIAEVLGSVDAAIEATKAVIDQTKTVKQGLLQTLLTRGIGHTKFKDSPLGEIPETWEVKTLGEIISSIDSGWSPDCEPEPAGPDEWGVLKTTSVVWEGFDVNQNKRLPPNLSARANLQVQERDVLITRAGPSDRVGVVAHVGCVRGKIMLSDKIIRLRFQQNVLDSKFAALFLSSAYCQLFLLGKKSGLAQSQTNISQKILCDMPIAVPSLEEQSNISGIADELISAISNEKAKLATLQTLKKGLMDDLLTGKVRVSVTTETAISNVVPFALTAPVDAVRKHALLSAEITAQLYHLNTFGATKREKLTDLVVRHVGLDETTDRQASRHAAGSYDPKARREIDEIFEREHWFKIQRGASAVKFLKGTAFGGHKAEFDEQFGSVKLQIQKVINLLRDYDTRHCEIIDTLYTAWNDFLIDGKSPSDDEIITEVLTNWHDSKLSISRQDWRSGLSWMRERDFVPSGRGRSTKAPSLL